MRDLHIYLPSDMHATLQGAAKARHVSVEEFVQTVLKEIIRQEKVDILAIRAGLAQAEAGQCLPHDAVMAAVDALLASKQA